MAANRLTLTKSLKHGNKILKNVNTEFQHETTALKEIMAGISDDYIETNISKYKIV